MATSRNSKPSTGTPNRPNKSGAASGEAAAALKTWREGLVGLTKQSSLIRFRAPKTSSLAITSPAPDTLLRLFETKAPLMIDGSDAEEPGSRRPATNVVRVARTQSEAGSVARSLMRRSSAEWLDRGLTVLWVAFGLLQWRESDGEDLLSPILLYPVQLIPDGPRNAPKLAGADDDPVLNPALVLRLKEFGVELDDVSESGIQSASSVISMVAAKLRAKPDTRQWAVDDQAINLAIFTFQKEAMYRDLLDNEAQILANPVVQALANSDPSQQTTAFQFDSIPPEEIDLRAPLVENPLVLDADASQRAAIAAAVAGKSFVMDGPPGTGKSQTIANMIGALLYSGKTVLFVSEKIAALDVVRERLNAVGLGSYLLELHSHKASRKEVAQELLRTLDTVSRPPVAMPDMARRNAKDRRIKLNHYAEAMNEVREPLGMTLHHVLGMYAMMADAPHAPMPETDAKSLSAAEYHEIQETIGALLRSWRPAAEGVSFLWRDVIDERSLEIRLYDAESSLTELKGAVDLNAGVRAAFGLDRPSDAPRLARAISAYHENRPQHFVDHWLTEPGNESHLRSMREELADLIAAIKSSAYEISREAGIGWEQIPSLPHPPPPPEPLERTPTPLAIHDWPNSELNRVAIQFSDDARLLAEIQTALTEVSATLGLPAVETFADIQRLITLNTLRNDSAGLRAEWFDADTLLVAQAAAQQMSSQLASLVGAEQGAAGVFRPEALSAPLSDLQTRFATLHKGLKKLSKGYRTDKKAVAAILVNAADVKSGISRLGDAIAWSSALADIQASDAAHQHALGHHWAGRQTDFQAVEAALADTREVLRLTNGAVPTELVAYLSATDGYNPHDRALTAARDELSKWENRMRAIRGLTVLPTVTSGTLADGQVWLTNHVRAMNQASARISMIGDVTGADISLNDANRIINLASTAKAAHDSLDVRNPEFIKLFGDHYRFADSDVQALDRALDWAANLKLAIGGTLTSQQLQKLKDSMVVETMDSSHERWTTALSKVVAAFADSRHEELATELDDYVGAIDLINEFREDTIGQQEWFDYRRSYESLAKRGLDTAINFVIRERVPVERVRDVVNQSLLRAWLDAMFQGDKRLHPMRSTDRDGLVEEYRELDRTLIKTATSDIIHAANKKRPVNTSIGEPGVIRREGSKQKRHIPVRDLIGKTRNTTQSIKPVFMMSPLAVSQYLPPDIRFDVVVFDEASQVTPANAINCIYRGDAVILAGDDKQLPPTSFFERVTGDDDAEAESDVQDFQSILELSKAAGAFKNLGLRWHYRSRHEDLIAFSNYKFYEGKLVTYPSARSEDDDVGVAFYNAGGTYKRGGGAINSIEAHKVAERVIAHYTNRPDLSLGVVTFSVAQAEAVQAAIDEARVDRRDLDRYFDTNDRLDGFFIRALEQVQGDERDVIIFSVGYGPDEAGKISTNFGALNRDKGWRRLNVGITRARQRVEVVASMTAGQIPPSANENVEYLRAYLDYAERGNQVLAVPYSPTGLDPESPFEESVLSTIRGWGYTVEPQVGAAGFRIDMGVRHPDRPGQFILGVECDGYQYHSAPAARDRDRLRDQILTGLGWRLHRIWGTAWYRDREVESKRLRAAIEAAIAADGRPIHSKSQAKIDRPVVESIALDSSIAPSWAHRYRKASRKVLPHYLDPGTSEAVPHMVGLVQSLVEAEGPIHQKVVEERLREWWGIGRIGSKIRSNLEQAVTRAAVTRDGDFLLLEHPTRVLAVRTPTGEVSRKLEYIHDTEISAAITSTVKDAGAVPRDELIKAIAKLFGAIANQGSISRVNSITDQLIVDKILRESGDSITMATRAGKRVARA